MIKQVHTTPSLVKTPISALWLVDTTLSFSDDALTIYLQRQFFSLQCRAIFQLTYSTVHALKSFELLRQVKMH